MFGEGPGAVELERHAGGAKRIDGPQWAAGPAAVWRPWLCGTCSKLSGVISDTAPFLGALGSGVG